MLALSRAPVAVVRGVGRMPNYYSLRAVAPRTALHVRAFQEDAAKQQQQQQQQREKEDKEKKQVQKRSGQGSMVRHDPYSRFGRLPSIFNEMQREMDALTRSFGMWDDDSFMAPFKSPLGSVALFDIDRRLPAPDMPALRLATDVEESDKEWTIKADIPGMSKEDIKLKVLDNTLTITGERKEEKKEGDADKPAHYERYFGSFMRSFTLPKNVNMEGITATAKDGVLTVVIPKVEQEQPKPKEIPVA